MQESSRIILPTLQPQESAVSRSPTSVCHGYKEEYSSIKSLWVILGGNGNFFLNEIFLMLPYSKSLKVGGGEGFAAVVSVMPNFLAKHRCCCLPSLETKDGEIASEQEEESLCRK